MSKETTSILLKTALLILVLIESRLASHSSFPKPSHRLLHSSHHHQHMSKLTEGRKLSYENDWRPISIKLDLSLVKDRKAPMSNFLIEIVLHDVINQLSKMIKVTGPRTIQPFLVLNCLQHQEIPSEYKDYPTDSDLLLFVKLQDFQENFLAYATNCLLNSETLRPTVGMIMINTRMIPLAYTAIQPLKKALLHELFHIIAFDKFLFKQFPSYQTSKIQMSEIPVQMNKESSNKNPFSSTSTLLTSKLIQETGSKHFQCSDFYGLMMENEGGNAAEQSHLEQTLFGNELMTAELTNNGVLSAFTLSLLASTDWYKIDFDFAEVLEWGKNAGCDFVFSPSHKFTEFCSPNTFGCSRMRLRRTHCDASKFSNHHHISVSSDFDTCNSNYSFQYLHPFEQPGAHSRCLDIETGGRKAGGCYKTDCSDSHSLKIWVDDKQFTCHSKDQKITYHHLTITCPDRKEVCLFDCPNDCSGNGICLANNTCQCNHFFTGHDCSKKRDCTDKEAPICSKIQPMEVVNPTPPNAANQFANVLKNVGQILTNTNQSSAYVPKYDKILKGDHIDFKSVNGSKQMSITASSSQAKPIHSTLQTKTLSAAPVANHQSKSQVSSSVTPETKTIQPEPKPAEPPKPVASNTEVKNSQTTRSENIVTDKSRPPVSSALKIKSGENFGHFSKAMAIIICLTIF